MARTRNKHFTQRGVALLAATVFISVTAVLVTEFSTNTTVDYQAAANSRDSMRAQFLARAGINISQLIIRIQTDVIDKNRRLLGDIQIADFVPMFIGAFGGSADEVGAVGDLLGGFAEKQLKGLGLPKGQTFNVLVSTDDGKINMNCANGSQNTRQNLQTKLEALLYFDAYNVIFENPDSTGWQRDRKQQVAALLDYVDRDASKADAPGSSEDYGYESRKDPYKPKNNYIDSIGELRLVRGVDERFWTLFGGEFTVYGGCKANVGALQDRKLIVAIIFLAAKNQQSPVLQDMTRLWALAARVADARSLGIYFDNLQAFADFVKNPDGALSALLQGSAGGGQALATSSALAGGMTPVEGVELDTTKLNQIARAGARRTYRIEATAEIGVPGRALAKKIIAVWDTNTQNQNMRTPDYARGAWVFWREE